MVDDRSEDPSLQKLSVGVRYALNEQARACDALRESIEVLREKHTSIIAVRQPLRERSTSSSDEVHLDQNISVQEIAKEAQEEHGEFDQKDVLYSMIDPFSWTRQEILNMENKLPKYVSGNIYQTLKMFLRNIF